MVDLSREPANPAPAAQSTLAELVAPCVQVLCGFGLFIGCLALIVGFGMAVSEPAQSVKDDAWLAWVIWTLVTLVSWDLYIWLGEWGAGVNRQLSVAARLGGIGGWVLSRGGLAAATANLVGLIAALLFHDPIATPLGGSGPLGDNVEFVRGQMNSNIVATERSAHAIALLVSLATAAIGLVLRWRSGVKGPPQVPDERRARAARRRGWIAAGGGSVLGVAFLGLFVGLFWIAQWREDKKVVALAAAIKQRDEASAQQYASQVVASYQSFQAGKEITSLLHDADPQVRRLALRILGRLDKSAMTTAAADGLNARLTDADQDVRREAISACQRLGGSSSSEHIIHSAVYALQKQFDSPDPNVRRYAAESLGEFSPQADWLRFRLEQIEKDDTDKTVRAAAKAALIKLQGNSR